MPHEVPDRWRERLRTHITAATGEDRGHLLAFDFPAAQSVRLDFPDGSLALFRYAFHLVDADLREVAVFTEHCGYHFFPDDELEVKVLQAVWRDGDTDEEDADDDA
jgi:hypothetical protein